MHNRKVILLCGLARGGTNIVWNILQSHPAICSPIHETGEIFRQSPALAMVAQLRHCVPAALYRELLDGKLLAGKLKNLEHPDNRYCRPEILYEPQQVADAALCLKSVDRDMALTDMLLKVYPDLYLICLSRNGLALCDGFLRRGRTIRDASRAYRNFARQIIKAEQRCRHFKTIKYEDVLADPFAVASDLFRFVEVEPTVLEELRLKSKKIINQSGDHQAVYGEIDRKYWFDRSTIHSAIVRDVDQIQIGRLSEGDANTFRADAAEALAYFGYR